MTQNLKLERGRGRERRREAVILVSFKRNKLTKVNEGN